MYKIKKLIDSPSEILLFFLRRFKLFRILPDKIYLKIYFYIKKKRKLDLNHPIHLDDKMQWIKLYDRKKEYIDLVDKYNVRKYIEQNVGKDHLVPIYGIYKNFEDIDFDTLPNQFVLKSTHSSGQVYICQDKKDINFKKLKSKINSWLKDNLYYRHREWPYKYVEPRIICEKLLIDNNSDDLKDYKFHIFNGKTKFCQVTYDRATQLKKNFYDTEWRYVPLEINLPTNPEVHFQKPEDFEKMLSIAENLAQDIPYVRVDLYYVNGRIYVGEITFFPGGGANIYKPAYYEEIMGRWVDLPK